MLRLSEPFFFQVVVKKVKNLCSREGDLDKIEKQRKNDEKLESMARKFSYNCETNESIQGEDSYSFNRKYIDYVRQNEAGQNREDDDHNDVASVDMCTESDDEEDCGE